MAVIWAACCGFMGDLLTGSGDLLFGWRKRGMRVRSGADSRKPEGT